MRIQNLWWLAYFPILFAVVLYVETGNWWYGFKEGSAISILFLILNLAERAYRKDEK
jgi:hypothetical protein